MKKKNEYHMNIGGASIILLIIVFSLTVFAVLSVRASYHEMKLAQKTRESVESYYVAENKAYTEKVSLENYFSKYIAEGNEITGFAEYLKAYSSVRIYTEINKSGITEYRAKYSAEYAEKKINVVLRFNSDGTCDVLEWRLVEYEHGDYGNGSGSDIGDIIIIE